MTGRTTTRDPWTGSERQGAGDLPGPPDLAPPDDADPVTTAQALLEASGDDRAIAMTVGIPMCSDGERIAFGSGVYDPFEEKLLLELPREVSDRTKADLEFAAAVQRELARRTSGWAVPPTVSLSVFDAKMVHGIGARTARRAGSRPGSSPTRSPSSRRRPGPSTPRAKGGWGSTSPWTTAAWATVSPTGCAAWSGLRFRPSRRPGRSPCSAPPVPCCSSNLTAGRRSRGWDVWCSRHRIHCLATTRDHGSRSTAAELSVRGWVPSRSPTAAESTSAR